MTTATKTEYEKLQCAYDYFNKRLFRGRLRECLITFQRKKNSYGYYARHRFKSRIDGGFTDEIGLNPAYFNGLSDEEILSHFVHQLMHMYQRQYCDMTRERDDYHDREWAGMMIEIGLIPSDTGRPGGKQTGHKMFHYIKEDGKFQRVCRELLATGFKINWQSVEKWGSPLSKRATGAKPKRGRVKYTCPQCQTNLWAKPNINVICGECYQKFVDNWDVNPENWSDQDLKGLTLQPNF